MPCLRFSSGNLWTVWRTVEPVIRDSFSDLLSPGQPFDSVSSELFVFSPLFFSLFLFFFVRFTPQAQARLNGHEWVPERSSRGQERDQERGVFGKKALGHRQQQQERVEGLHMSHYCDQDRSSGKKEKRKLTQSKR